ncbi:MAG TPA: hypothetical protein PLC06_10270 [Promineifilum sp.]|nr:hypothetical protein [Promineifilum sp.]
MMSKGQHRTQLLFLAILIALIVVAASEAVAGPTAPGANAGWEEIGAGSASGGGISNTTGKSRFSNVAVGPDGMPVVAWLADRSGTYRVYVRRWDGTTWTEMGSGSASDGGISNNVGDWQNPALAIGPDGMPVVAWAGGSNISDGDIYVRRWDGTTWAEIGAGSASGGGISNGKGGSSPSVAIDHDGAPIVAWVGGDPNIDIYVRRWDGTAWVEIGAGSASGGGISNTSGWSGYPSLAVGPDGAPVVAWSDGSNDSDDTNNDEIYVRRWDGTTWVELGGSGSGGGISNTDNYSWYPTLAIDPDGMPIVAWDDRSSGNREIYVRRWDGTAWAEMGAGSATGGGISHDPFDSQNPSLAIGPDGMPVVAWAKYGRNGAYAEVYVRRWDGAAWAEMDAGSATGGGISNTKMDSWRPSLAIGPVGAPVVTWFDNSSDKYQIYVRRYRSVPGATFRAFTPAVIFEAQPDAGASGD